MNQSEALLMAAQNRYEPVVKPPKTKFWYSTCSYVVKDLKDALSKCPPKNHTALTKCLKHLSKADYFASEISESGILEKLCDLLSTNTSYDFVFYLIETFWNILESPASNEAAQRLGSAECLSVMKEVFDDLALNGHRQNSKQLRNELLVVFIRVVELFPESAPVFLQSNLLDSVSLFLTHPELDMSSMGLENFVLVRALTGFDFVVDTNWFFYVDKRPRWFRIQEAIVNNHKLLGANTQKPRSLCWRWNNAVHDSLPRHKDNQPRNH